MITAIGSAQSGLNVYGGLIDATAGNLANLNTPGYQSVRLNLGTLGASGQNGSEAGLGAQILSTTRDLSSGPLLSNGVEGSNVDPAQEMVNLITGQEGFTANVKSLQTASGMLGNILDAWA